MCREPASSSGEAERGGPALAAACRLAAPAHALPSVLHLSSDYPDPLRPHATQAVRRLVDHMCDRPQIVISLHRTADPRRVFWRDFGLVAGRRLVACGYFAPPLGLGMYACQAVLARRVEAFLGAARLRPAVVHAHRFSFEGIAAWMLARRTGAALFCSVRGEVESKVFAAKPLYRPLFRRMARDATRIYHVSAWFRPRFEAFTGVDPAGARLLPNMVMNARPLICPAPPQPRIVGAMNLDFMERKGLDGLLAGFARAGGALDGVALEIVGGGAAAARARAEALVARHGLAGRAALRGSMPHEALLAHFGGALAMALPSFNETFGMVYPEALFAGAPILHSAGTGIDGYLDGLDVGVAVRPGDAEGIAAGLVALVRDNARLRANIRDAAPLLFERFDPDALAARYRDDVEQAAARRGA